VADAQRLGHLGFEPRDECPTDELSLVQARLPVLEDAVTDGPKLPLQIDERNGHGLYRPTVVRRAACCSIGVVNYTAHPTAVIDDGSEIGYGTRVWHFVHIRSGARIGAGCTIGKGVYVDAGVTIGRGVKIQNNVSVYHGVEIGNGVFVGPHVCFTNDRLPRAVRLDMSPAADGDWTVAPTMVEDGASIGANATIVAGVTLGRWSMVGAGAVVTRSVRPYGLVVGNPARLRGVVAPTGEVLARAYKAGTYWTADRSTKVEIEPGWVPTEGPRAA
jgi:acetyltransferase-like isoleucine patch superfamily enzyme